MTESTKTRRILMVDEEEDFLHFHRKVFEPIPSIEFYTMTHPRIAIQVAEKRQPELLITEIYFPKSENFDGEYLTHTVRGLCPGIKVMVCSVLDDEGTVSKFLGKLKVDCYLKKPCPLEIFVKKAFELLNEPYPFKD